ncbi:MAG: hypothetical protein IPO41_14895 [Acidobacteria bacterium]|nr:hypothetical protein [Acidobacteriota bacterium]
MFFDDILPKSMPLLPWPSTALSKNGSFTGTNGRFINSPKNHQSQIPPTAAGATKSSQLT